MRKFRFLLLDAGPIIKLFELGIWDKFIERCDVTVARVVAEESIFFVAEDSDKQFIDFGLKPWEQKGLIEIVEVPISEVKAFHDKLGPLHSAEVHAGEEETLAFLYSSSENWRVCSSDHAVFRVLGLLGKGDRGVSLEEVLERIGLSQHNLEWQFTKKFRERYTRLGQIDSVQGKGFP